MSLEPLFFGMVQAATHYCQSLMRWILFGNSNEPLSWRLGAIELEQDVESRIEQRLGRLHARLRLGIEADHEAQVFGQGINSFHCENLPW
jgi:hypothetical protein